MEVYYRHLRQTVLTKDYTLAGVVSSKGTLLVGLAVTHPNDYFSRKVGREVSFEHAHNQPLAELVIQDGDSAEYTFYKYASTHIPKQAFDRAVLEFSRSQEAMENGMMIA